MTRKNPLITPELQLLLKKQSTLESQANYKRLTMNHFWGQGKQEHPDQHEDQQPQLDLSFDKEDGGVEPGDITEHQSVEQEENSMPELEFNNLVSSIMDELKQDNRQYLKEVEMEFAIKPESDMDSLTARSHI